MSSWIGLGLLGVLLASAMPIFVALGATAALLLWTEGKSLAGIAQIVVDGLNSNALIAVPFFVMAAIFMDRGGVARALIDGASAWVGRARGGLAIVCVVAATIFAAVCGSSTASAMALGTVLIPAMMARGYDRPFSVGVIGASGTLGILIPPSLPLIVFGIIADESVPRLFVAGIIPGLIQAALFIGLIVVIAHRRGLAREPALTRTEFIRRNMQAIPALVIPVVVLGGIYSGIVTVTEAAALAALMALVVSLGFYRDLRLTQIPGLLTESMRGSAAIILIVASALVFGHWMTESGLPARLVQGVIAAGIEGWQFLLIMNLLLLVLGCILEVISIILITLPVVLPILASLGIDPIHYAIILTVNMEIAVLTPPVGLNLFVMSSITGAPMAEVVRGVSPFIFLLLAYLGLITYVPEISTFLPRYVFGS
ncbi:MAG: TRAP transporter large permease [Alphaproteobacteria bacterium]